MGIEPYLVASSLEMVVAQRLVRLICPQCKAEEPPEESRNYARNLAMKFPKRSFAAAVVETAREPDIAGVRACLN